MSADEVSRFVVPARVFSRQEVLARVGCTHYDSLALLHTGISPDRPPGCNFSVASRSMSAAISSLTGGRPVRFG